MDETSAHTPLWVAGISIRLRILKVAHIQSNIQANGVAGISIRLRILKGDSP